MTTPPVTGADAILAKLSREGRVLPLRGLSESQVGMLVEQIAGERAGSDVVRTVHRATNGNPLYVDSITHLLVAEERLNPVESGTGEPGGSVSAAVAAEHARLPRGPRLTYLDDESRTMLRVAAVIGRTFTLPVLGMVVGRDQNSLLDLLDDAVDRGTIRASGSAAGCVRLRAHPRPRRAVSRARTEQAGRAALARRQRASKRFTAATSIRTSPNSPTTSCWRSARDATPAGPSSTRPEPAQRAMAQTAYDEAAAHFRRALDTLVSAGNRDPTRRCDLLLTLGAARTRSGDTGAGRSTYLEAAALARELGLADRLASAAIGYAGVTGYHFSGRRDETLVALLEEAIAALPPGDSHMRVRLLARLSVALYWSDLDGRRFELSEEAVAMARRLRDQATLALAIHSRRYAQWGPDNFEQRLADAAQCRTLAHAANELELAVSASRWRFTDLLEDGDVAAADRELDSHAELAERLHQPFLLAHTTQFRALRAIMQGRFADGEALADEARVQAAAGRQPARRHRLRSPDVPRVEASWRARTARRLPPHSAARRTRHIRRTPSAMALIHAELGERETAAAMVEQLAGPGFGKFRHDMLFLPCLTCLTLVLAELADSTHAEEIYDLLRPYAGRVVIVGAPAQACWGPVDHYLGVLAVLGDRPDWAADHFEAALVAGARLGTPALLAETRLRVRQAARSPASEEEHRHRAMALLDAAQRTASALGLHRLTERLADLPERRHGCAGRRRAAPTRRGRRHATLLAAPRRRVLDGDHPWRQHPRARRQRRASPRDVARPAGPAGSRPRPRRRARRRAAVSSARPTPVISEPATSKDSVTPVRCSTTPPRTPIAGASPSSTS